jgi:hypothetical protein
MAVRQKEWASHCAHLLRQDSLVGYQDTSMRKVNQYGIIYEEDPLKLSFRGVACERVGSIQEDQGRCPSLENWRALDSIVEVQLWMVEADKPWFPPWLPIGNVLKYFIWFLVLFSIGLFLSEVAIPSPRSREIGGFIFNRSHDLGFRVSGSFLLGIT